jgi:hypothetical protein
VASYSILPVYMGCASYAFNILLFTDKKNVLFERISKLLFQEILKFMCIIIQKESNGKVIVAYFQ